MGNKGSTIQASGKVVIIGGGYGGISVAKKLEDVGFEVTLINRNDCFFHCVGSLRSCYKEDWENVVCIPYTNFLKREGAIVIGEATAIDVDAKQVTALVGTGEDKKAQEFNYDYLILATGSAIRSGFPASIPIGVETKEYIKQTKEFRDAVRESKDLVIIGGGPVGVELAAEMRDGYPDKNITIISSAPTLLSNSQPSFQTATIDKTLQKLEQHKITVVLNKKVDLSIFEEGKSYLTGSREVAVVDDSTTYHADFVIRCIGYSKLNSNVKTSSLLPKEWLNDKQQVKVNKFLQVEAVQSGNIFALGDMTDLYETKLTFYIQYHSEVVVHNVISSANGNKDQFKEYHAQAKANGFITIGAKDGVAELGGKSLPNIIGKRMVVYAKGKTLLVEDFYQRLNATLPEKY